MTIPSEIFQSNIQHDSFPNPDCKIPFHADATKTHPEPGLFHPRENAITSNSD
jgi:hypothetical protein